LVRRVTRTSGKSELASHLVEAVKARVLDVFLAFSKRLECVVVLEDVKRFFDRVPFFGGDDDRGRPAFACDHDMFMAGFNVIKEFGEMSACLREGNDPCHRISVQISAR
jgi:hypothetical protein